MVERAYRERKGEGVKNEREGDRERGREKASEELIQIELHLLRCYLSQLIGVVITCQVCLEKESNSGNTKTGRWRLRS